MYVITGASGNIGSKIAEKLLSSGQKVRVIARRSGHLNHLAEKGAEAVSGSLNDAAFLTRVFEDAKAVFAMIPTDVTTPNIAQYQDGIGEAIASAISSTNVPYVINLSSIGGEHKTGTGPIAGLHRQEQRLNQLEKSRILHLRPTYFMENFSMNIPMIKNMGINGSMVRPDLPMPFIATYDIAEVAANYLLKLDYPNKTVHLLLGPRDYTFAEATRILGKAIGKPDLPYVQFSESDMEHGLIAAGISANVAKSYIEMQHAMNSGIFSYQRKPENTTPTTLEQFALIFATVYSGSL